jgi:hypothetical protein
MLQFPFLVLFLGLLENGITRKVVPWPGMRKWFGKHPDETIIPGF